MKKKESFFTLLEKENQQQEMHFFFIFGQHVNILIFIFSSHFEIAVNTKEKKINEVFTFYIAQRKLDPHTGKTYCYGIHQRYMLLCHISNTYNE